MMSIHVRIEEKHAEYFWVDQINPHHDFLGSVRGFFTYGLAAITQSLRFFFFFPLIDGRRRIAKKGGILFLKIVEMISSRSLILISAAAPGVRGFPSAGMECCQKKSQTAACSGGFVHTDSRPSQRILDSKAS